MQFHVTLDTGSIVNDRMRQEIERFLSKEISFDQLVERLGGDPAVANSLISMLIRRDPITGFIPFAKPRTPEH